jgi:hypothetical protein
MAWFISKIVYFINLVSYMTAEGVRKILLKSINKNDELR